MVFVVHKANRFRLIIPIAEATTQPPVVLTPNITTATRDDRSSEVYPTDLKSIERSFHWVELTFSRLRIEKT